jgi:hypothetical protein
VESTAAVKSAAAMTAAAAGKCIGRRESENTEPQQCENGR